MGYRDLRNYLEILEEKGKLKRIKKEVDKDWEISSIARCMFQGLPEEERYALLFENIKGFNIPLVTAAFGASREVYALALGTTPENIYQKWGEAHKKPIPPVKVSTGPVKEVIKKGNDANLYEMPVPIWTPSRDAGPYITAPCVITVDPETGIQNMGTYRMQVKSKNRTGLLVNAAQHVGIHYFNKWVPLKKPMPIAVAIGVDPAIGLTSVGKT